MSDKIVPEIPVDLAKLREILTKEISPGWKLKKTLNGRCLRVVKSFGVATEVYVRKNTIIAQNTIQTYIVVSIILFWPAAIYFFFKTKEAAALRSSVHDILFRATRKA
jgi:hypothetical protein